MKKSEIVLFVMSEKGLGVLKSVISAFSAGLVHSVFCSRDKNVQYDYYAEILQLCRENGIRFIDRKDIDSIITDEIKNLLKIAVSWRWIINPSQNLIVIHDSILPKYRGFAPLVTSLIEGEIEIGVTAIKAADEYDMGDIVANSSQSIEYPIKIEEAIKRIKSNYDDVVIKVIDKYFNNPELTGISQVASEGSFSLWLDEEDYKIDWSLSASRIVRFINAVGYPYKGAYTLLGDEKIRIIEASEVSDVTVVNRSPGKVIFIRNNLPTVVCGSGLLEITKAVDDKHLCSVLPLKNFRTRLK